MFAIPGPEFLVIYLVFGVVGTIAYHAVRRHLRCAASRPIRSAESLSPVMVGYLVSGATRARAVAAAVRKDAERRRAGIVKATIKSAGRVIVTIRTIDPSDRSHRYDRDEIHQGLADRGLILGDREVDSLRYLGSAIFGGLLAAGIARLLVGLSHQRPSGLLFLLLLIVAVALLVVARTTVIRTVIGDEVVEGLTARAKVDADESSVAMSFALLGWSSLSDEPELQGYLQSEGFSPASLGAGTSGDSGGDSGGGGCGGCGGCGS